MAGYNKSLHNVHKLTYQKCLLMYILPLTPKFIFFTCEIKSSDDTNFLCPLLFNTWSAFIISKVYSKNIYFLLPSKVKDHFYTIFSFSFYTSKPRGFWFRFVHSQPGNSRKIFYDRQCIKQIFLILQKKPTKTTKINKKNYDISSTYKTIFTAVSKFTSCTMLQFLILYFLCSPLS